MEKLGSGRLPFARIDLGAYFFGDFVSRLQHAGLLLILAVDRNQNGLDRRKLGRKHEPLVVGMAHDESTDQARADAPTGLPHVVELSFARLKLHVEGAAEILAEVVAGSGLKRETILHHGFNGEGAQRACELFRTGFRALDHGHGHDVFGYLGVDVQHPQHLLLGLEVGGVSGVALLPEKLGGAQEHTCAQLPTDDVGPLIQQHREVAVTLNPLGEKMSDDGFRRRPDDVGLFQFFAAGYGDHRQLRREAFDVLRFPLHEALRNQQGEINVLVPGGLEAVVELALQQFPDGIAVGLDDHAAFDDLGRLGHVALQNHVLVPRGEILAARSDGRFGHKVLRF